MLEKAVIAGVTHTSEEALYRVEGVAPAALFSALADAGVSVDTIVQTGRETLFSAPDADPRDLAALLDGLGAAWSVRDDLGQVSIVGAGMESHPGIAAKTFATLDELGIEPQAVTTSPIKIACHVPAEDVERAVRALHAAFELHAEAADRAHV